MPLPFIGAALSAIPAIYSLIQGGEQKREARKTLDSLERPTYEIPSEIAMQNAMTRQAYADPTMPGQQMLIDQTRQTAANAFAQAKEAGNPFAIAAQTQGIQNQSLQNINVAVQNRQLQDMQQYMGTLQNLASYRDKQWQLNQFAPYLDKYREARDMLGAGEQNIYGGLSSLSNVANVALQAAVKPPRMTQQIDTGALEDISSRYTTGYSPQGLDNLGSFYSNNFYQNQRPSMRYGMPSDVLK